MSSRVVRNDLVRNALLREFPGGEGRALRARTGFAAIYVKFTTGGLRAVKRRGRRTNIDEGEPACIAMGEDAHSLLDQRSAMLANLTAMFDIFLGKCFRRAQSDFLAFTDCFASTELRSN